MDNLTAGNPLAHAVRVYYEGSSTIYEGMPVCYNYLTTENWFGGSVSDGVISATNTTAEGGQNEGKYIRVVNPAVVSTSGTGTATAGVIADANLTAPNICGVGTWVTVAGTSMTDGVYKVTAVDDGTSITVDAGTADVTGTSVSVTVDNLMQFAGVVKRGGWCGTTGPKVLDIYVPNGAIVPVRCDVDTTVAASILGITSDEQELGQCGDGSRPVAIAMETEADLDTTADITLAKLNPDLFIWIHSGSVDFGDGASDVHRSIVTSGSTTGMAHFDVQTTLDGAIASGNTKGVLSYMNLSGTSTGAASTYISALHGQTNISGTLNGNGLIVTGMMAQVHGSGTITKADIVAAAWIDLNLTGTITSANVSVLHLSENCTGTGANSVNQMIYMRGSAETAYIFGFGTFGGGNAIRTAGGGNLYLRIHIDGVPYTLLATAA